MRRAERDLRLGTPREVQGVGKLLPNNGVLIGEVVPTGAGILAQGPKAEIK